MNKNILKVLHSNPVWLRQTQTWLYNQVRFLPEDIEQHIVCMETENLSQFNLPNIHKHSNRFSFFEKRFPAVKRLLYKRHLENIIKKYQPAILHSHFGNNGWQDLQMLKKQTINHVVTFYGYDVSMLPAIDPIWEYRYLQLFENVDGILCEGPHMAKCIVDLGCPPEKVHVHPLGIDISSIPFKPRTWSHREPLKVLIVAAFREKKGIPYALQALSEINKKIDIEITIIGDANNTERSKTEKNKIMSLIDTLCLKPRIRMLGYQPHSLILDEALRHHLFLSPSVTSSDGDTEGGAPVTIIEMAASGIPVVSTSHCDIPEVIRPWETGLLANERNVGELVSHINWFCDNPDKWKKMLEAGRNHIEKNFSAKKQGEKLSVFYHNLCAKA